MPTGVYIRTKKHKEQLKKINSKIWKNIKLRKKLSLKLKEKWKGAKYQKNVKLGLKRVYKKNPELKQKKKEIMKEIGFKHYLKITYFQNKTFEHNNTELIIDKEKDIENFENLFIKFCKENNIRI